VALLAGCSFQDFSSLNGGGVSGASGASSAGTESGASGGTEASSAGGDGETSGSAGSSVTAGKGGSSQGGTFQMEQGGEAGEAMAGAPSGGTGAVGQIVNPSFETASTSGWTVTPSDALSARHVYVQPPTGTINVPDGAYQLSTWHMTDTFEVEIFQTISGLEDGTYIFKGYFSLGVGLNGAQMFARNCGGAEVVPLDLEPITMSFEMRQITGIEVVGGSCEVGIAIDSNPQNWLNADLFSFEKEAGEMEETE
jgi:hypothetical protein